MGVEGGEGLKLIGIGSERKRRLGGGSKVKGKVEV